MNSVIPGPALTLFILTAAVVWAAPAAGQDRQDRVVSEIRAGIMYHDAAIFVVPGDRDELRIERTGLDINLELLFVSPGIFRAIGSPRPHIGVTANTQGATSQAYAGLTWNWDMTSRLFFEFNGGGAVHNGETDGPAPDPLKPYTAANGQKLLGCSALFRLGVAMGVRFAERQSLTLALDHISNGHLCELNPGLDTLGLRWGYRF